MQRSTFVVDASVAVKWVLPEDGHEEAVHFLERYQDEEVDLVAPHLVVAEVANVLWRRERRGELSADAAQRCFREFLRNCPILLDAPAVSASALVLALAHGRTAYDCLYLAWALEQRCDLLTADKKFFNHLSAAFPCIKLLQDFPGV